METLTLKQSYLPGSSRGESNPLLKAYYRMKCVTSSAAESRPLPYHHNKYSCEFPGLDHSVVVYEKAMQLCEWLLPDRGIEISKLFPDLKDHTYRISKNRLTELVAIAAIFHDAGFNSQYKGNEFIGSEIAVQWMSFGEYSNIEKRLVMKMIPPTDVVGVAVDEESRKYMLETNPLALILVVADLTSIVSPIGGKSFHLINWLFRQECIENSEVDFLHKKANEWTPAEWVEDASAFYASHFKEYEQLVGKSYIFTQDGKNLVATMFGEIRNAITKTDAWTTVFERLDLLRDAHGIENVYKAIGYIQTYAEKGIGNTPEKFTEDITMRWLIQSITSVLKMKS